MKRWLFTSPYRHWKNGEKDMAVKVWLINITVMVAEYALFAKLLERMNRKAVIVHCGTCGSSSAHADACPCNH